MAQTLSVRPRFQSACRPPNPLVRVSTRFVRPALRPCAPPASGGNGCCGGGGGSEQAAQQSQVRMIPSSCHLDSL